MAIVQVSRITNRKGLTENLPQLAGAELGWCIDSRRLFIGNGTLQDGAPVIGNTEILTEFSDITALSNYTYQDIVVGYAAQTGPTPSDPTVRTIQAKLDDFASVRDFGAVGDGVTDDTAAINRALYQLYCVQTNTEIRRALYFPAGTYVISETIVIPTYAKLVGEGADCSIISLDYSGDISSLSAYVARFGDSLQQTGVNIGNNGAVPPRNIEISSMTFQTVLDTDVFLVETATQCYFDSVNFLGPLTTSDITTDLGTDNIAGVRFSSTTALPCNQITFDKCRFGGLTYGINTGQQIQSVTVSNSKFDTLYQGIVLGTGSVTNGGAVGFRAQANMFDSIYAEGIIYDDVNNNVSAHNIFLNVGNEFGSSPQFNIVYFGNYNNVSVCDMFERSDADNNTQPRVEVGQGASSTTTQLQMGRYVRTAGSTLTLSYQASVTDIFTISSAVCRAFKMYYTVIEDTSVRHGVFTVVSQDSDDSALTLSYTDDFTENAEIPFELSASPAGQGITVEYVNTGGSFSSVNFTYSISHLA